MQPISSNSITESFISQTDSLGFINYKDIHLFNATEIIRCEAGSDYNRFNLNDQKIFLITRTLGEDECNFLHHLFLRIHRSGILPMSHVITMIILAICGFLMAPGWLWPKKKGEGYNGIKIFYS